MKKFGVISIILLLCVAFAAKFILFDYVVSSGKRVVNLTKLSKKGKVMKTWEGTLDEGSGDKLTSYFSVKSSSVAQELYEYEGRKVIIFYNEHFLAFPQETKYDVVAWKPATEGEVIDKEKDRLVSRLQKTLFCSFLGTLIGDQKLYQEVKSYIKKNNLYLFKQYQSCN